ncbi:PEP-utilizing enzyme [Candidatus Pelagibacter sp.]|nr:PEP-utilizing enzyme [Candidatus Pelagibacter sp.]
MKFSTKAKNLLQLDKLNLKKSVIPKFYKYSVKEILEDEKIILYINNNLGRRISIRSSFFFEDGVNSSMAGEFEGYSNVANNKKELKIGIKNLVRQYRSKTNSIYFLNNSEVIFQNYISDTNLSGVITNKCIKDGSDYYVINYDDTGNLTDTVTSGSKTGGRVLNVFKHQAGEIRSKKFKKIISSFKELEKKIGNYPLDVEFGLNKKNQFFIFQVRLLSTFQNWKKINNKILEKNIINNQKKFKKIFNKNKDLGRIASFGLMPDWNPAEMIGYQPDQLSYSLYKKLITDSAWSTARHEMKYKNVNRKLMISFSGKPYIDTRLSFFSFIPNNVSNVISKKIVNFWLMELNKKPFLHDKVEFDIADSGFDLNSKKKIFSKYTFLNNKEKKNYFLLLKKHTEGLINSFSEELDINKNLLFELENFRRKEIDIFIKKKNDPILLSNKFIKKLIIYGIIPFSKLARHAFIGKKFLNSLLDKNLINSMDYSKLLSSIHTVASDYRKIKKECATDKKKLNKFNNYFFHLRAGTYDVKTKRFISGIKSWKIDNFDSFFKLNYNYKKILSKKKIKNINNYFKRNNIKFSAETLLTYSLTSIKLRENSKFIFTRTLSDILELIKYWSKKKKLPLKIISNMSFEKILKISKKKDINFLNKLELKENIIKKYDHYVKLPYLITTPSDFYVASILITKPNFITKKIVEAHTVEIDNPNIEIKIANKIVIIENADPGYDWVLSQKIKGLITKYGGVNSHMSIRCEELNMPASIGVGDKNFDELCQSSKIILNCKENKIDIIN